MAGIHKYQCNSNFFKKWSYDMAYILGFIAADGNIYKNTLSIDIHYKDIEILTYIKSLISPQSPIRTKHYGASRCLNINSKELVASLKQYNITPCKSRTISINFNIPKKYIGSFIRGIFDGDGSVYIKKQGQQILAELCSASKDFIYQLKELCGKLGIIRERYRRGSENPLYILSFNQTESMKLKDIMYTSQGFCLERKKKIFYTTKKLNNFFWTLDDKQFLINNYKKMKISDIATKLNKTQQSIKMTIYRHQKGLKNE